MELLIGLMGLRVGLIELRVGLIELEIGLIELGIGVIERGIGVMELGMGLIELGIGPRIHNVRRTVLALVYGLVIKAMTKTVSNIHTWETKFPFLINNSHSNTHECRLFNSKVRSPAIPTSPPQTPLPPLPPLLPSPLHS